MKKLASVILVLVMVFTVMAPVVSAVDTQERLPIIYVRGNGDIIYYPDGTKVVARLEDLSLGGDNSFDTEVIIETAVNILKPVLPCFLY